jgi:putative transposase
VRTQTLRIASKSTLISEGYLTEGAPARIGKLVVTRPNQVWFMDIKYGPMARGFVYPAAVTDWFSHRVLAWRLSITLSADFRIESLNEAPARHDRPEIFNTDRAPGSPVSTSSRC